MVSGGAWSEWARGRRRIGRERERMGLTYMSPRTGARKRRVEHGRATRFRVIKSHRGHELRWVVVRVVVVVIVFVVAGGFDGALLLSLEFAEVGDDFVVGDLVAGAWFGACGWVVG